MDKARFAGFRRSCIQATKKKIVVEVSSSDYIYTIIAKNRRLLADDGYLKALTNEANKKIGKNEEKIRRLKQGINK